MDVMTEPHSLSRPEDSITPTASTFPHVPSTVQPTNELNDLSSQKTPTRDSFHETSAKRPLPESMAPPTIHTPADRRGSIRSIQSLESGDVEMGEADDTPYVYQNDSLNIKKKRPSKKKKSQKFFCTEYPPCQLSFTRSEHLARHIRFASLSFSLRF